MKQVKFTEAHSYAGTEYKPGDPAEVSPAAYTKLLKKGVIEKPKAKKRKK